MVINGGGTDIQRNYSPGAHYGLKSAATPSLDETLRWGTPWTISCRLVPYSWPPASRWHFSLGTLAGWVLDPFPSLSLSLSWYGEKHGKFNCKPNTSELPLLQRHPHTKLLYLMTLRLHVQSTFTAHLVTLELHTREAATKYHGGKLYIISRWESNLYEVEATNLPPAGVTYLNLCLIVLIQHILIFGLIKTKEGSKSFTKEFTC